MKFMSRSRRAVFGGLLASLVAGWNCAFAQGTAFTYQGRLSDTNGPVSGSFDVQFSLYATNAGGNAVAGPVTNLATAVSGGLFLSMIDFGGVFTGTNYWLDIAVRTNGTAGFTALWPRQAITPVPYALSAATAGSVIGEPTPSQLNAWSNALTAAQATNIAQGVAQSLLAAYATSTNGGTASVAGSVQLAQTVSAPLVAANNGLPKLGWDSWPFEGAPAVFRESTNYLWHWTNCGMQKAGWTTAVIDDGWCMGHTNINGNWYPLVNATNFPSPTEPGGGGFLPLVQWLAGAGMRFGVYSENTPRTSAGYWGSGGGYEVSDVTYYITNWNIAWLRWDGTPNFYEDTLVSGAIKSSGRDVWLQSGNPAPTNTIYELEGVVNSVKSNPYGDSFSYPEFVANFWAETRFAWNQTPGFLTEDMNTDFQHCNNLYEDTTQWGLEALLSQSMNLGGAFEYPLGVGYFKNYVNQDVLAIDQDPNVKPATLAFSTNGVVVWVKPLGAASPLQDYEVGLWNTNSVALTNFTFTLAQVGIPYSVVTVRDSWLEAMVGYATNAVTVTPWNISQDDITGNGLTNLAPECLTLLRISPGVRTQFAIGTNALTEINWLDATNDFQAYGNMVGLNRDIYNFNTPLATNFNISCAGVTPTNNFISFADWGMVKYFLGGQADTFTCAVGLGDYNGVSDDEVFWFYTNEVLVCSNTIPAVHNTLATQTNVAFSVAGANTLTIVCTHAGRAGQNCTPFILNPQVVCSWETVPNAASPNLVSYNFAPGAASQPGGTVWIAPNSVVPSPIGGGGYLWNSNSVLYWVTATHTNYLGGP